MRESGKNLFGTYRTFIAANKNERREEKEGGEESFSLFFLPAKRQQEAEERNINDLMSFQRENNLKRWWRKSFCSQICDKKLMCFTVSLLRHRTHQRLTSKSNFGFLSVLP